MRIKRVSPDRRFVYRQNTCPKCFAPPGVPCESAKGKARAPVHRQRMQCVGMDVMNRMPMRPAHEFYDSDAWRRVRYQALKKHGGSCQLCGARGTPKRPVHVDHIKPRSKFPWLSLDLKNLQVLCEDCNLGKSNTDDTDWRA